MSSVSPSWLSSPSSVPSSWSWASVVCVVGRFVIAVAMGIPSRVDWLSLMFAESPSVESQFRAILRRSELDSLARDIVVVSVDSGS